MELCKERSRLVVEAPVIRVAMLRYSRNAARIVGVLVDRCAALVVVGEETLDFPVVDLGSNGELEIFAGDGVPVLCVLD